VLLVDHRNPYPRLEKTVKIYGNPFRNEDTAYSVNPKQQKDYGQFLRRLSMELLLRAGSVQQERLEAMEAVVYISVKKEAVSRHFMTIGPNRAKPIQASRV
jgi:hypothetical protein